MPVNLESAWESDWQIFLRLIILKIDRQKKTFLILIRAFRTMEQPVSWMIPPHPRPDYPLFIFLPGMDGSGQLYHRQIKHLAPYFDLRCLVISPQYLGDWEEVKRSA
jgi:hypothetical protein